jgi:hypothetical protein
MKIIRNIKSENILTIDIETVRYLEKFSDLSDEWKSAWSYKNKQEGIVPSDEELGLLWEKSASLYAEFSKVCAISMTYLAKDGVLKCKTYAGTSEEKILKNFESDLTKFYSFNSAYRILGHAAKYFDIPFLCKRYMALELDIPSALDESQAKPWEMVNLDTNELWRSFGTGAGSSLQALCALLQIPTSKADLVGDEVGKAYFKGDIERISKYCSLDTIATFNVFRKFKKESIFAFSDVVYVK